MRKWDHFLLVCSEETIRISPILFFKTNETEIEPKAVKKSIFTSLLLQVPAVEFLLTCISFVYRNMHSHICCIYGEDRRRKIITLSALHHFAAE